MNRNYRDFPTEFEAIAVAEMQMVNDVQDQSGPAETLTKKLTPQGIEALYPSDGKTSSGD